MDTKKKLGQKKSAIEILVSPEMSVLIPLLILVAFTAANNPKFLTIANIQVILKYATYIGVLAIGEAFALMCGEIDLSVGTASGLCGMVMGVAMVNWGLPIWLSIVLAIVAGAIIGYINAFLTLKLKINSWITTMAMQYICGGLATVLTLGKILQFRMAKITAIYDFNALKPMGLTWLFFIFMAFIIIGEIVIRFTPVGRKIHAVGLSVYAARVAGINVNLVKTLCFVACSTFAGITGVFNNIQLNCATPSQGTGNDFPAIICCVIGGVSNMGGKGTMLGCLLGVIMYQTLKNCLQMLGANANMQLVLVGIILIFAVYIDVLKVKLSQRVQKKKEA